VEDLPESDLVAAVELMNRRSAAFEPIYDRNPNLLVAKPNRESLSFRCHTTDH
jgi:hypothetical protein